jgi:hypothetical protein
LQRWNQGLTLSQSSLLQPESPAPPPIALLLPLNFIALSLAISMVDLS